MSPVRKARGIPAVSRAEQGTALDKPIDKDLGYFVPLDSEPRSSWSILVMRFWQQPHKSSVHFWYILPLIQNQQKFNPYVNKAEVSSKELIKVIVHTAEHPISLIGNGLGTKGTNTSEEVGWGGARSTVFHGTFGWAFQVQEENENKMEENLNSEEMGRGIPSSTHASILKDIIF